MSRNDGGAAFPFTYEHPVTRGVKGETGMSLRDYFAAQSLVLFSTAESMLAIREECKARNVDAPALIVAAVYEVADAMLAERAK